MRHVEAEVDQVLPYGIRKRAERIRARVVFAIVGVTHAVRVHICIVKHLSSRSVQGVSSYQRKAYFGWCMMRMGVVAAHRAEDRAWRQMRNNIVIVNNPK